MCDNLAIGSNYKIIYFLILIENIEFIENPIISTMIYNIEKINKIEFHNTLFRGLPEITTRIDNLLKGNSIKKFTESDINENIEIL